MNREILFRAWHIKEKKWITWFYVSKRGEVYVDSGGAFTNLIDITSDIIREQYTGLKDKNGKRIFEGDIVKYSYGVGYASKHHPSFASGTQKHITKNIEWSNSFCGYSFLNTPRDSNVCTEFEIIGTIHENPELLVGEVTND